MKSKIDFNCDMGESFGTYEMGLDEKIINHCEINYKDQFFNYFKSFVIHKISEDNKVFNYDKKYLDTSQKIFKELNKLSIM